MVTVVMTVVTVVMTVVVTVVMTVVVTVVVTVVMTVVMTVVVTVVVTVVMTVVVVTYHTACVSRRVSGVFIFEQRSPIMSAATYTYYQVYMNEVGASQLVQA